MNLSTHNAGPVRRFALGIVYAIAMAIAVLSIEHCSGAQQPWPVRADAALTVAAHGLAAVETGIAQRYRDAHAAGASLDQLEARYQPIVSARNEARTEVVLAEQRLEIAARLGTAQSACEALAAVRSAGAQMRHLGELLAQAGLPEAPTIADAAHALFETAAGLSCPGGT